MKIPRGRGSLDRRVSFFQAVVSQSTSGQIERTWPDEPIYKRWAQKIEVPPSLLRDERQQERTWVAKSWVGIRVPYDQEFFEWLGTDETKRFEVQNLTYDIISSQELPRGRRRYVDIMGYTRTDKSEVVS